MKDLNLLYVFEAIWRTRSVSGAADELGLSQAAVSSSLKRLRDEYDDKLFALVARQMEPTPYACTIAPSLLDSLATVRATRRADKSFDPSCSNRMFTIRTRDIGEVVCIPPILRRLETTAPGIGLRTTCTSFDETLIGLSNGRIDFAMGLLHDLHETLHSRQLFRQQYVCIMRKEHPLAGRTLRKDDLPSMKFLIIDHSEEPGGVLENALLDAGLGPNITMRLPNHMSAPYFVLESDLVYCAPSILARELVRFMPLAIRPLPLTVKDIEISLYWHDRYHQDPGNRWLREFIVESLKDTAANVFA